MAVLVTGGAGYIGAHMVHELVGRGERVIVLDNLSTGFTSALPREAIFIEGNTGDIPLVSKILAQHNIESILHFAASIVVPDSVQTPLPYYANNTMNTRNMLACAVDAGIKHFIFSSTAAVYGETSSEPVSEDTPLNPVSPYGRSKLMSEWMLQDVARAHPLRYIALRYFNVAGADPQGRCGQSTPRATHLIKVACEAATGKRKGMEIFGTDYPTPDGTCLRDYIHVSDLARAHADALAHLRQGGKSNVFNAGYGTGYSVKQIVDAVKRISGVNFEAKLSPRRLGDPAAIVAKATRIREVLGWQPKHANLDEVITHALNWEKRSAK